MVVPWGFYMRSLPSPPAVDFSSSLGKKLFTEGLHNGTMEGFFKLISLFQTQSEPAYCGLATLAMVLNALSIDPCTKWKGPWRWFDESMLDWCEPLEKVKVEGISLPKAICLANCAGAKVEAFRTDQTSLPKFRSFVMACCASHNCHLISSYDRRVFQQTGIGHFSPIGGYHADTDMVLILDVARFKYPPHWVPLSLLWQAMDTIDDSTGLNRGFMLVSRPECGTSFLHTLSCKQDSLINAAKYFMEDVPLLLSSHNVKDVKHLIRTIISSLPPHFVEFINCVAEVHRKEYGGQQDKEDDVLKLIQDTRIYNHVTNALSSKSCFCNTQQTLGHMDCLPDILIPLSQSSDTCHGSIIRQADDDVLTEIFLSFPPETWCAIKDQHILKEISSLVFLESFPLLLQDEVLHIRGQLLVLKRCHMDLMLHL